MALKKQFQDCLTRVKQLADSSTYARTYEFAVPPFVLFSRLLVWLIASHQISSAKLSECVFLESFPSAFISVLLLSGSYWKTGFLLTGTEFTVDCQMRQASF